MSNISQSPNAQWYRDQLDSMGPHASKLQQERFAVAVDYLEANYKIKRPDGTLTDKVDRQEVLSQLNSIDFHKEVNLKELKRDNKIYQHKAPGAPTSEYFTSKSSTKDRLGITEGEGGNARVKESYYVKEDMVVLESHTRDTKDVRCWGRHARDTANPESSRLVNLDNTNKNGQVVDQQLRKTDDAKISGRVYSSNRDTGKIEQRSGEYAKGGDVQYHIPEHQHKNLCSAHRPAVVQSQTVTEKPSTRTQKI